MSEWSRRAALAAIGALCAASITGCGVGHMLDPHARPILQRNEALLVIATEALGLVYLSLCEDGNLGTCLTAGPISPSNSLQVYVVPAGHYCLTSVRFEPGGPSIGGGVTWNLPSESYQCFTFEAATLAYPGHYQIDVTTTLTSPSARLRGWRHLPTTRAQLDTAYPLLRGQELFSVVVAREPH